MHNEAQLTQHFGPASQLQYLPTADIPPAPPVSLESPAERRPNPTEVTFTERGWINSGNIDGKLLVVCFSSRNRAASRPSTVKHSTGAEEEGTLSCSAPKKGQALGARTHVRKVKSSVYLFIYVQCRLRKKEWCLLKCFALACYIVIFSPIIPSI